MNKIFILIVLIIASGVVYSVWRKYKLLETFCRQNTPQIEVFLDTPMLVAGKKDRFTEMEISLGDRVLYGTDYLSHRGERKVLFFQLDVSQIIDERNRPGKKIINITEKVWAIGYSEKDSISPHNFKYVIGGDDGMPFVPTPGNCGMGESISFNTYAYYDPKINSIVVQFTTFASNTDFSLLKKQNPNINDPLNVCILPENIPSYAQNNVYFKLSLDGIDKPETYFDVYDKIRGKTCPIRDVKSGKPINGEI